MLDTVNLCSINPLSVVNYLIIYHWDLVLNKAPLYSLLGMSVEDLNEEEVMSPGKDLQKKTDLFQLQKVNVSLARLGFPGTALHFLSFVDF